MIYFNLSSFEKETRALARNFAKQHLANAKAVYSKLPTPAERFR